MSVPLAPKGYSALLIARVPRPIRSRKHYEARLEELTELMARERNAAESEYLELLVMLIKSYESDRFKLPKATPLEILHELMDVHGMKQADLARLTGSTGIASEVCTGKRRISIGLAKKLAQHFNVAPGSFI